MQTANPDASSSLRTIPPGKEVPPLRPAATVVLVRNGSDGPEVLMLRRSREVEFIGGAWVFPGGAVDKEDCPAGMSPGSEAAARQAAAREAEEEAAVKLDAASLLHIAHWTAPKESPKRYSTWFFLAAVEAEQAVTVDGSEISSHCWFRPQHAIEAQQRGEISILPPTFITLQWLCEGDSAAQILRSCQERGAAHFAPKIVMQDNAICNLYVEDAGYADGNPELPGPRHRFWMIPGNWYYEASF